MKVKAAKLLRRLHAPTSIDDLRAVRDGNQRALNGNARFHGGGRVLREVLRQIVAEESATRKATVAAAERERAEAQARNEPLLCVAREVAAARRRSGATG